MASYKTIKGFKVQTLASDTSASVASTGSWSAGGSMNTARDYVGGAAADKDSALIFGGSAYNVEQYDGSSWTEKTEMNCPNAVNYARSSMGTATACIAAGGSASYSNLVEQWDGSSWTEIAELNTGRGFGSASPIGTVTAGLVVGGLYASPGQATANSELWNGSAWTETNNLNTARSYDAGLGTSTSAMVCAGQAGPPGFTVANNAETWDGSSWTEVAEVNTARARGVAAGESSTSALFYSGATGPSTGKVETEFWDGSSWTEVADLATARMRGGGGGTAATAIMAAGRHPAPATAATEEWSTTPASDFTKINLGQVYYNSGSNAFKVTQQSTPTGTWSAGGDLSRGVAYGMQGAGASNNAAIATGGQDTPSNTVNGKSEQYNGTSWTEVADLNLARTAAAGAVASPYSNTLYFSGGSGPLPSWSATTEAWDNSSWTEVGDLNSARNGAGGAGSSNTSALCMSGEIPNNTQTVNVEEYNGSSWTETANVNDARRYGVGLGTATAGLYVGGDNDPGYATTNELWNGSSWTEVGDMNTARSLFGTGGTTTLGLAFGGRTPSKTANTETWNGTSWTEIANLATARSDTNSGGGSGFSSLFAGGYTATASVASTEEFTAASSNKTITVS